MKSDIYNQTHKISFILSETERLGDFCKLTSSEKMKLRLLTEEVLGLTVRLFDNLKYDFYIENEKKHFTINLKVAALVDSDQKEKVLSLSSEGKNIAEKGILGKISDIFGTALSGGVNHYPFAATYSTFYDEDSSDTLFSLRYYQSHVPEDIKKAEWDGLEKSIIAHFADDVTIGVSDNKVEVIATITL